MPRMIVDKTLDEIKTKIKPVPCDSQFSRVSYSGLDVFASCPYRYQASYEKGFRVNSKTLALEIGTLCHLVLEFKGNMIMNGDPVNYDLLKEVLFNGYEENTEKSKEIILGVNALQSKYLNEWYQADNKSGMNYSEKVNLFVDKVLTTRLEDSEWEIIGTEVPFNFLYDDKIIFHGFIDRVDKNKKTGELRITDYKTSKASYPDSKIKTPLQHIVYDMACLRLYGQLPIYHEYDFILINQKQNENDGVCSKGYLKRGIKKIDKLLDNILCHKDDRPPKPSPLCHWCPYSATSKEDNEYHDYCQYYSLWTPEHKTFTVNMEYGCCDTEIKSDNAQQTQRKIIFDMNDKPKRKILF